MELPFVEKVSLFGEKTVAWKKVCSSVFKALGELGSWSLTADRFVFLLNAGSNQADSQKRGINVPGVPGTWQEFTGPPPPPLPHSGVHQGRSEHLPWPKARVDPVKVPVNGSSGEVPAVETCTNGPVKSAQSLWRGNVHDVINMIWVTTFWILKRVGSTLVLTFTA